MSLLSLKQIAAELDFHGVGKFSFELYGEDWCSDFDSAQRIQVVAHKDTLDLYLKDPEAELFASQYRGTKISRESGEPYKMFLIVAPKKDTSKNVYATV